MLTKGRITRWLPTAAIGSVLWDGRTPGFGARKRRTRSVFVLAYRTGRRVRWLTLGQVGVLPVAKARQAARVALGKVSSGADPAAIRDATRAAETVTEAGEKWLDYVESLRKPRTAAEYRALWARAVKPRLGTIRVREVTRADVARLHSARKKTPGEADHALAVLSSFFNWCERLGLRSQNSNPCKGVPRYSKHASTRYLSEPEFERLGRALAQAELDGVVNVTDKDGNSRDVSVSTTALRIIRLLALTGARLNEIRSLRWDAIDSTVSVARLKESKTGAKVLPLARVALDVIEAVPRLATSEYVFPAEGTRGKRGRHFQNVSRTWFLVRRAAGLTDVRIHDLRHSAAGVAASAGTSLPIIGKLLGHSQAATTQRYAHVSAHPAAQTATLIGDRIASALAIGAASSGKVLPFASNDGRR